MLGVYICTSCGLVQLKNPAKLKQQLKETGCGLSCPKCGGSVTEAEISYTDYSELSEEERKKLTEQYQKKKEADDLKKAKKILITGANGQLGHALNKMLKQQQAIGKKYEIYNTSRSKGSENYPVSVLDITSEEEVKKVIEEFCPDLVINCAAHTGVDLCEEQEEAAYAMNALGPKYLAEAAKQVNAVFVHISTDYVFPGTKEGAYLEEDQTGPESVYGRTKLAGEDFVRQIGGNYFIVRTAWLYGDGKNFVKTMLRLSKDHRRLTVVNDQKGTPTSADELARAILFLSEQTEYGTYHATCEGQTTWYLFAKKIFEYSGMEIELVPVSSEEYQSKAKRPKNSVLENRKLNALSDFRMKDWESALKEYLVDNGYGH